MSEREVRVEITIKTVGLPGGDIGNNAACELIDARQKFDMLCHGVNLALRLKTLHAIHKPAMIPDDRPTLET